MSALAGGRRTIHCPADGSLVAEIDEAGADDTEAAIAAAHRAFHEGPWPTTSARERGDLLLRTADLMGPEGGTPVTTSQMGDRIVAALSQG